MENQKVKRSICFRQLSLQPSNPWGCVTTRFFSCIQGFTFTPFWEPNSPEKTPNYFFHPPTLPKSEACSWRTNTFQDTQTPPASQSSDPLNLRVQRTQPNFHGILSTGAKKNATRMDSASMRFTHRTNRFPWVRGASLEKGYTERMNSCQGQWPWCKGMHTNKVKNRDKSIEQLTP